MHLEFNNNSENLSNNLEIIRLLNRYYCPIYIHSLQSIHNIGFILPKEDHIFDLDKFTFFGEFICLDFAYSNESYYIIKVAIFPKEISCFPICYGHNEIEDPPDHIFTKVLPGNKLYAHLDNLRENNIFKAFVFNKCAGVIYTNSPPYKLF
jgi:hypothetical protein